MKFIPCLYGRLKKTWCLLRKKVLQWIPKIIESTTFSVKLLTQNLWVNKTQAAQMKNIHAVFKHFHQNTRAYPRSKKNLHWPMIGKILHIGKKLSKERCWKQAFLTQIELGGVGLVAMKALQFFPSFKLGSSSSST